MAHLARYVEGWCCRRLTSGLAAVAALTVAMASPASAASPPTVVTERASAITLTSATLNATVNPNSEEVTKCAFEYGTTTSYGSSAPCSSLPGSGEFPAEVSASVTGLSEKTTYHFRIVATNASGTSYGEDETFSTNPPTVVTEAASSIRQTSATLHATVNPNGRPVTSCYFQYGTSTSYSTLVPCTALPGSGEKPVQVSMSIAGLSDNTTYHFRFSATNLTGQSKGKDETFTTLAVPHWQKNGTKPKEGEKVGTISWGTITLEPSSGGTVTCKSASAANIENTAAAAKDETLLFDTYECKAVGGECTAKGGETRVGAPALPWPAAVREGEGIEEYRQESSGVQLNIECYKAGVLTEHALFKSGPVGAETGTWTPTWQNGTTAGRPSELVFDASSGHLFSEAGGLKLTTKGKLKVEGYEEVPVPVITVANSE